MLALSAVLFVIALVAGAVLMAGLRHWMLDESRTEARLHAPEAHTVVYVVPDGEDPAGLLSALARAGFTGIADSVRGDEVLVIECPHDERETVRRIIETVRQAVADAHPGRHSHQVRFQDDPIGNA
jgi:hypothetical protein